MGLNEFIDLLGAISPILAAVIAFLTAKHTTRKELQKMKEQWKREDTVLENRDFSEMISAVSKYCQSGWSRHQREALEKIAAFQSYCHRDYFSSLADLQSAVLANDTARTIAALAAVNQLRHDTVNGKRK